MSKNTHKILDVGFDFIDYPETVNRIREWAADGSREVISVTNPHTVLLCAKDPDFAAATEAATLTVPDGIGIILAARILGYAHHGRVTGPTLMLKLCDAGREQGWSHYFYGGHEGVSEQLAERLTERFPGLEIAGTHSPPFRDLTPEEDEAVVKEINEANPDILWVGLGAPKQEKWIHAHRKRLNATVMIGVGAAFDFHSGKVPWPPAWIRAIGLEWLFRLCLEPQRMWRRNVDSFPFLWKVLHQKFGRGKSTDEH